MKLEKSYVYFIKRENSDSIKIGKSSKPTKRFSGLKTSSDEELICLALFDEDIISEKELHEKFSFYRKKGEWFSFSKDIHHYITVEMKDSNIVREFFPEVKLEDDTDYRELSDYYREKILKLEQENKLLIFNNKKLKDGYLPVTEKNYIFASLKEQLVEVSKDIDEYKKSIPFKDKSMEFIFEKLINALWHSTKLNMARWYYWNINNTYPVMTIMSMLRKTETEGE